MGYFVEKATRLEQRPPRGAVAIPLGRGFVAWVDEGDFALLGRHHWHSLCHGDRVYAVRNLPGRGYSYMHREIMSPPDDLEVDHLRHRNDGVSDNRRCNLRLVDRRMNNANRRKSRGKSSPFKGVSLNRQTGRWEAYVAQRHLGRFPTEAVAARAHDVVAVEMYGDHALTNFPIPGSKHWLFGPVD